MLRLHLEPSDGPVFWHEVCGESAVFGRSSKADVAIADRCLSRLHARLILREGGGGFLRTWGRATPPTSTTGPCPDPSRCARET